MGKHSRVIVDSCQRHERKSFLSDEKMESARFGSGHIVAGAMSPASAQNRQQQSMQETGIILRSSARSGSRKMAIEAPAAQFDVVL